MMESTADDGGCRMTRQTLSFLLWISGRISGQMSNRAFRPASSNRYDVALFGSVMGLIQLVLLDGMMLEQKAIALPPSVSLPIASSAELNVASNVVLNIASSAELNIAPNVELNGISQPSSVPEILISQAVNPT
ncbi:MAG: hypothetical protein F6K09_19570, partial [Merismopedia sp. SIO2A8]|nr:hypothetical protein [Merismopedia sp. SIO2A8]